MAAIKTSAELLKEVANKLSELSDADIKKLSGGGYELAIKVIKRKGAASTSALSPERIRKLQRELNSCESREAAETILKETLETKREAEQFAKSFDVLVLKQDKFEQIISKIVEATVGAVLRSNAIKGKKT